MFPPLPWVTNYSFPGPGKHTSARGEYQETLDRHRHSILTFCSMWMEKPFLRLHSSILMCLTGMLTLIRIECPIPSAGLSFRRVIGSSPSEWWAGHLCSEALVLIKICSYTAIWRKPIANVKSRWTNFTQQHMKTFPSECGWWRWWW